MASRDAGKGGDMEIKNIRTTTFGLAGAIDGDSQEGVSTKADLPPARCARCNCSLSQSTLRAGFEHCNPCRSILRDQKMGLLPRS